jgi:lipopolysaccharide/colanic/teichoic acid biosynthesis glycosyltransferase
MNETATPLRTQAIPFQSAVKPGYFRRVDNVLRRVFDVVVALLSLALLAPLFGVIALLVKRDSPGPVFYWGKRVGRNGREFNILKFRTMYETAQSYSGPRVTGQGDQRITPLGQWLRDTKLNELPQLWNVLKGEMSFVGPRPEDRAFVAHWPADARAVLLAVRPGITSPASVLFRDEENMLQAGNVVDDYLRAILPSKLRLDLLYVHHRSFLTDLDVIFWTLLALLPRLKTKKVPEHLLFWGPLARFISRYFSWFVLDSLTAFGAVAITGLIWRSSGPLELGIGLAIGVALSIALIFSLVNALLGVGRVVWSKADINDALSVAVSTGMTTLILLVVNYFWHPRTLYIPTWGARLLPTGMLIVIGMLCLAGFIGLRYRMRIITGLSAHWITLRGNGALMGERVLIVGAGEAGELAAHLLRTGSLSNAFTIVGMVDDAPRKQDVRISGCRVLGRTADIPRLAHLHDVGLVLFAIENIGLAERQRILNLCRAARAQTVIVPDLLAAFRAQLPGAVNPAAAVQAPRLQDWLTEIDALMEAEAWNAAHRKLHEMQQMMELVQ